MTFPSSISITAGRSDRPINPTASRRPAASPNQLTPFATHALSKRGSSIVQMSCAYLREGHGQHLTSRWLSPPRRLVPAADGEVQGVSAVATCANDWRPTEGRWFQSSSVLLASREVFEAALGIAFLTTFLPSTPSHVSCHQSGLAVLKRTLDIEACRGAANPSEHLQASCPSHQTPVQPSVN